MTTYPPPPDIHAMRRGRLGRRLFTAALVVFLGLGLLGAYGVRTREARATGGGYEVTVTYARVSRPGLATPWSVEIRRPGGFGSGPVRVAVTSSYFDAFDENGLDPDPASSYSDGEWTVWEYGTPPPPGDVMTVSFDARIEPGVQLTTVRGAMAVLDTTGADVVGVDFRTFVLP